MHEVLGRDGGADVGDGQQFDIEDELGFGGNGAPADFAVSHLIGDEEAALAAGAHTFEAGFPAGNHPAAALYELKGLVAVARAIELPAVAEPARVVNGVLLTGPGRASRSGFDLEYAHFAEGHRSAGKLRNLSETEEEQERQHQPSA